MKNKVKHGIIITVLTLVGICLIYGAYIAFFTGVKSNGECREKLNEVLGDNYTMKQYEKELYFYRLPAVRIPIPYFERYYDVYYKDHTGKESQFSICYSPFPEDGEDYSLKEWRESQVEQLEHDLYDIQEYNIYDVFAQEVLDKYFDGDVLCYDTLTNEFIPCTAKAILSGLYNYRGDGYVIDVTFPEMKDYLRISDISISDISPDLFKPDVFNIYYKLTLDEDHLDKMDEYIEKMDKVIEETDTLMGLETKYTLRVYTNNFSDELYYRTRMGGEIKEEVFEKTQE